MEISPKKRIYAKEIYSEVAESHYIGSQARQAMASPGLLTQDKQITLIQKSYAWYEKLLLVGWVDGCLAIFVMTIAASADLTWLILNRVFPIS